MKRINRLYLALTALAAVALLIAAAPVIDRQFPGGIRLSGNSHRYTDSGTELLRDSLGVTQWIGNVLSPTSTPTFAGVNVTGTGPSAFNGIIDLTGTKNAIVKYGGTTTNLEAATAADLTNTVAQVLSSASSPMFASVYVGASNLVGEVSRKIEAGTSDVLTGKTFDAAATGNVLKQTKYLYLGQAWHRLDNAGCVVVNSNDFAAVHFMMPQFSGSAATNANTCRFALVVPPDIDTTVDLTVTIKVELGGADTADHIYHVGMASVADSAAASATAANFVAFTLTGDASGASGDIETVTGTLTAWKSNVTAGQFWIIELRRDGANDASTQASYLREMVISYGSTL